MQQPWALTAAARAGLTEGCKLALAVLVPAAVLAALTGGRLTLEALQVVAKLPQGAQGGGSPP